MLDHSEKIDSTMLERIMQYCDGTLPPAEARAMAARIAADPTLREIADDLTLGASLAREAFAGIANQPLPISLARAIANAPEKTPEKTPEKALRKILRFPSSYYIPREVAAALIGLLIGAGTVGLYAVAGSEEAGLRLAGTTASSAEELRANAMKSRLMDLLQTPGEIRTISYVDSGQPDGRSELSVVSWLALSDGSPCAEFAAEPAEAGMTGGIACRRVDGGWDILVRPARR